MIQRTICLIGLVAIVTTGQAQTTHNLWLGGGLRPEALRDHGYSPLIFDGIGFSGMAGYEKKSDKRETVWLVHFSQNQTTNNYGRELTATTAGILNLNFYKREDKSLAWGWSSNNGLQHRFISGFDNFNGRTDFFTSFGPAAQYHKEFSIKEQSFSFTAAAHVQLIGFYKPSGYVASLPSGFGYEPNTGIVGFWESLYFFYPGGAYNAGLWPKLEWHLSTGNSISLNYLYEYTRLTGAQTHERSAGMWILNVSMALK
jgi:hypothetical protein